MLDLGEWDLELVQYFFECYVCVKPRVNTYMIHVSSADASRDEERV